MTLNVAPMIIKLLIHFKTPLIVPTDITYVITHISEIYNLIQGKVNKDYKADVFDCDDFAFSFKALASRNEMNSVGIIVGKCRKEWHAWNFAVTKEHIVQIEPQTGMVFFDDLDYKPMIIII